jgi:hypothetical protein
LHTHTYLRFPIPYPLAHNVRSGLVYQFPHVLFVLLSPSRLLPLLGNLHLPTPQPASVTSMALIPTKRGVKGMKRVSGRCVSICLSFSSDSLPSPGSSIVNDGPRDVKDFGAASMLLFTTLP